MAISLLEEVMFTGIIHGIATVASVERHSEIVLLRVSFPEGALVGLQTGASIAVNGCCLTAVAVQGDLSVFDMVQETMSRTNLGSLEVGDKVNFERSLKFGDEVGGHIVSGHIDTTGILVDVRLFALSRDLVIQLERSWTRFVFEKGYIALNGASLTAVDVDGEAGYITVSLIPETIKRTTFEDLNVGAVINLEVDRTTQAVVKTVERILDSRKTELGVSCFSGE